MPKHDLCGQSFGRMTVVLEAGRDKHKNVLWKCVCECGNVSFATTHDLESGHTRSCGCLRSEVTTSKNTRNRSTKRSNDIHLYNVWAAMKQRCCNSNHARYKDYGGRGITLCNQWMDYEPFYEWAMANGYRRGLDIDRINNDAGYSPDNCRFITRQQNCRNKRDNRYITLFGTTRVLQEWCDIFGLDSKVISHRISRGASQEEALTRGLNPDALAGMMEVWDARSKRL